MKDWPHAPVHRFGDETTFFITGATYQKQHLYRAPDALNELQDIVFAKAEQFECCLQAWALLVNHYHLVVRAEDGSRIRRMLNRVHTEAGIALNARGKTPGRQVWFQYWDKTLTFEASWLTRLRYTHENAVHHRLVSDARNYPWCSASWFERTAPRSLAATVARMKIDRLRVYEP